MNLRRWLDQGPFSLSLSAGFFGFYSHCGFIKALWETSYRPSRIMGASAGTLTGVLVSAGMKPFEIETLFKTTRKEHFWDLKLGLGLLEGMKFEKLLKEHLPETFDQLEIPFSAAVYDIKKLKTFNISEGPLIEAVRASCCFPILFHPVKMKDSLFVDGAIGDWMGLGGTNVEDRVLIHFLEPKGFGSDFVKAKALLNLKKNHYVYKLKECSAMGPNRMHEAERVIEEAYVQTRKALQI